MIFGIRYRNLISNKEDFKLLDVSWVEYVIFETKSMITGCHRCGIMLRLIPNTREECDYIDALSLSVLDGYMVRKIISKNGIIKFINLSIQLERYWLTYVYTVNTRTLIPAEAHVIQSSKVYL